jgi:hypothetical protein
MLFVSRLTEFDGKEMTEGQQGRLSLKWSDVRLS